ncbi:MAG: FecR family protein, partial [Candidatus Eremiobacterota bacterium]
MSIRRCAAALFAAMLLVAGPVRGETPVAQVIEIKGPKLEYQRSGNSWYRAFLKMDSLIKDQFRTDKDTIAALDFYAGGRVGINKGTEIVVISESDVKQDGKPIVKRIKLTSGRIYAKMGKRTDTLEIETNGGVMGIKGTEFSIESEQTGGTRLAVYEGEVEYRPTGGPPVSAKAGTVITIPWGAVEIVRPYELKTYEDPDELRRTILNSQEWQDFQTALNIASLFTSYIPSGVLGEGIGGAYEGLYYASMAADFVNNPEQAAVDYATSVANSYIPGPFGIPRVDTGGGNKVPPFPTEPNPPDNAMVTGPPTFSWKGTEDARRYLVVVSRDENFRVVDWSGIAEGTSITYPGDAAPLPAGLYYWRVLGVDEENKPIEGQKATQTRFTCSGWGAPSPPPPDES